MIDATAGKFEIHVSWNWSKIDKMMLGATDG
jgi:hypothetical protein